MKIEKYKKAMRKKKYLNRDFIVYKGKPYNPKKNPTNKDHDPTVDYGDPDTWGTSIDDFMTEQGLYKEAKDERE